MKSMLMKRSQVMKTAAMTTTPRDEVGVRTFSIIAITTIVFLLCFGRITDANAPTAYVPIRQMVATGTYHTPNYLSVVKGAIGRERVFRMFSDVVGDKWGNVVGRFGKNETLVYALQKQRAKAQLLGHYAEERFVELNREAGWKKVNDRFAPQRDIWRINPDTGKKEYGQVKTHGLGKTNSTMRNLAAEYIKSMRKDSGRGQASLFLVPDDHFDSIKGLIDERHSAAVRNKESLEASWLLKQRKRLTPLGVSYETMSSEANLAARVGRGRIVARYAGPTITVLFLVGSTGYETYRWSSGQSTGAEFAVQLGKVGSFVTLGIATSYLVAKSEFLTASPYRAAGIVTAVFFIAEEGWLIYQHGGFSNALSSPAFYVKSGGNIGAATLGLGGFLGGAKLGAVVGTPFGPVGTAIGGVVGSVIGGTIGGMVGYYGGATMTDWMLETFSPEFYYGMKLDEINKAEGELKRSIDGLSDLSRPLAPIGSSR
jgi:hypothetical protein